MLHADRQTEGRTDRRKDGRTDMTKLIVAFRNFANAPKTRVRKLHKRIDMEELGVDGQSYYNET